MRLRFRAVTGSKGTAKLVLTMLVGACASPTGPTRPEQPGAVEVEQASPMAYLAAVGCRPAAEDSFDGNTVTFRGAGGDPAFADCAGVSSEARLRAFQEYRLARDGTQPGTAGLYAYQDGWVTTYWRCELDVTKTYFAEFDEWVVTDVTVGNCRTWRVYHYSSEVDGAWGGSGATPTKVPEADPVDSLTENTLNFAELLLCAENAINCTKYVLWSGKAWSWARSEALANSQGWVDNKFDAWRHAAWSAALTISMLSTAEAERWTEARELSSYSAASTCMDRHNNAIGREVGAALGPSASWEDITNAVKARADLQLLPHCNNAYAPGAN